MKEEEVQINVKALMAQLSNLIKSEPRRFDADTPLPKEGVYAIWGHRDLLYVGKSTRLRKRLLGDHRSGNRRGSAFRRALAEQYGLDEQETTDYIVNTCCFRYLGLVNTSQIEHFAIAVLKPRLNK